MARQFCSFEEIKNLFHMKPRRRVIAAINMVRDLRLSTKNQGRSINTLERWNVSKVIKKFQQIFKNNPEAKKYLSGILKYEELRTQYKIPKHPIIVALFGGLSNLRKALDGEEFNPRENETPTFTGCQGVKSPEMQLSMKLNREQRNDPEYQLQTIIKYKLWDIKTYNEMQSIHPDIIPDEKRLRAQWGGYAVARETALRYAFSGRMFLFLQLADQLGRMPTAQECSNVGASLEEIQEKFGNSYDIVKAIIEITKNPKSKQAKAQPWRPVNSSES